MGNGESEINISLKEQKGMIDSENEILSNAKKSNKRWTLIWLIILIGSIIERIFYSNSAPIWRSIIFIVALIFALLGLIVQSTNFEKKSKSTTGPTD